MFESAARARRCRLPSPRARRGDRLARARRSAGQRRLRAGGRRRRAGAARAGGAAAVDGRDHVPARPRSAPARPTTAPLAAAFAARARRRPARACRACTSRGRCCRPRAPALTAPSAIAAAGATLDEALADLLAAGVVRLVTLAPERPGALALIARLRAGRRRRQPGPHRRDVRADGRRDRRGRDAGDPPLQRDVAAAPPRAGRGRRRAGRRSR